MTQVSQKVKRMDVVPTLISKVVGKMPPNDVGLEQAVLGAVMLEKGAMGRVADILNEDDFYQDRHMLIWQAFDRLVKKIVPIDMLMVMDELTMMGALESIGGPVYLAELTNMVGSTANIEYHAIKLKGKSFLRKSIFTSTSILGMCYDPKADPGNVRDEIEKSLAGMIINPGGRQMVNATEAVMDRMKEYEQIKKAGKELLGMPTTLWEIDEMISGLQAPDLIIVAARPGMGKTSFILSLIYYLSVLQNFGVAIWSLEMSAGQLVDRLLASIAEVDSKRVKNPSKWEPYEAEAINKAAEQLGGVGVKLLIDDSGGIGLRELCSKARKAVMKGAQLIMVDYIQIMGDDGISNVEQATGNITRGLKALAKELNVPVIALSQLTRENTKRPDKRPQLNDLRNSGSIEQDADVVMFLHRPEYYNQKEDNKGRSLKGICEVIFAKNRHGALGTKFLRFVDNLTLFKNLKDKLPPLEADDDLPF